MRKLNIFYRKSNREGGKLSTLLAAFIMLLISASTVQADNGDEFIVDNLKYKIISETDKTVELVTWNGTKPSGELIIPATVTDEGNSYSVTSIGDFAFVGCSSLTSVTIPENVTSIGEGAFNDVRHIINKSKCTDPDHDHWGARAENGTVDGDFVYENDTKTNLLVYIGKGGEVTIPEGVTAIGNDAFRECTSLTSVTIPEGVTSIGAYAFWGCSSLTSLTIPEGVTSIGNSAFKEVRHIINKSNCTDGRPWGARVENGTVDGDFVYEDDTKAKLLVYIGKGGDITIPESVTSIGERAFDYCRSLTSVTIPEGVTSIDKEAFRNCTNIENVYLYADPDNLTWNEYRKDDFKQNGETKCHVLAEYVDKYKTKFKDEVNVTFEGNVTLLTADDITTSQISDVTYSGTPFTPEIEVKYGDKTLEAGTDYTITYTNNINAGTAKATIKGIKLYIFTKEVEFTINPVPVTVTAENKTKTFGESDPEFTANVSGLINNESPDLITYTLTRTEGENVGEYTITPKGDEKQGNYEVRFVDGKLTITPAPVTVTAENKTKTFGESDPEFTANVSGLVNNESPDLIKYTITRTEGENVGEYTITPKGDEKQGNYVVTFVDGKLTINENPNTPVSSIDNNGNNVKVWSYAHTIYIETLPDSQYKIIDLQGRTIKSATTKSSYEEVNINNSGIYVVIINGKSYKVSL